MTKREAAIVSAHTGIFIGDVVEYFSYLEEKLGRQVTGNELRDSGIRFFKNLRDKTREDFLSIKIEEG